MGRPYKTIVEERLLTVKIGPANSDLQWLHLSQTDWTVEHLDRMGSVSSTFSAKVREES